MPMKMLIFILITFSILKSNQNDNAFKPKKKETKINNFVTLGSVELGSHAEKLPIWKVDAAMNLVDKFTSKFTYYPLKERNEILDSLTKNGSKNAFKSFLKEKNIYWVFNFRINQIQNILGVTLEAINLSDSTKKYSDYGFAYLNLKDTLKKTNIYDIALTNAIQRAIAKTLKDSTMFKSAYKEYQAYPFPTLAVGGLEFINNDKFTKWNLFKDKQVTSYDMVESIWEEVYKQERFIAYDIESRDSLYTLFNVYGIENYTKPRPFEIKALNQMEVQYFITGTFQRVADGARIKMQICRVNKYNLDVVLSQEEILTDDSIDELRKSVKSCTKKLIDSFRKKNG